MGSLKLQNEDFVLAEQLAQSGYWWDDRIRGVQGMSDGCMRIHGLSPYDSINFKNYLKLVHHDDRCTFIDACRQLFNAGESFEIIYRIKRADDNELRYIENRSIVKERDHRGKSNYFGIVQDITHFKECEDFQKNSGNEDILLQEVHHRVKNNLSALSGLLELQSYKLHNEKVKRVLKNCQNRVQAIAKVHEAIYRGDNLNQVKLCDYLNQLAWAIEKTFTNSDKEIVLRQSIEPEITVPFDRAVPLALLFNEVIVNAYQHAFEGRNIGCIQVEGMQTADHIIIAIRDDGVGMDVEAWRESDSMGGSLVRSLSDQLDADMKVSSNGGTEFVFTFDKNI